MALLYILFAFLYGVVALYITGRLSAVDRTLVDSCRTVFVWACDLFIYYIISKQYGDPWTVFSWLQVGSLVLMLSGTLISNEVIKFPCLDYTADALPPTNWKKPPTDKDPLLSSGTIPILPPPEPRRDDRESAL